MKVVKSNLLSVLTDIDKYIDSTETVVGYLVADRVAIWEPTQEKNELDEDYLQRACIYRIPIPTAGGIIVNNICDIGVLVISPDMFSRWEYGAMQALQRYLERNHGISSVIQGNDMLINDKKFVGTSHGFVNNHRISAIFISMNCTTEWLIRKICKKPTQHSGFTGLYEYNLCIRHIINVMLTYTKRWEERGL